MPFSSLEDAEASALTYNHPLNKVYPSGTPEQNDALFPIINAWRPFSPHATDPEIRQMIGQIISELNASPDQNDFLQTIPLRETAKSAQDSNPNHLPAGSSQGGQFAPKAGASTSHSEEETPLGLPKEMASSPAALFCKLFHIQNFSDIPEFLDAVSNGFPLAKPELSVAAASSRLTIKEAEILSKALEKEGFSSKFLKKGATHAASALPTLFKEGTKEWLQSHEGINGSHTLTKHVGQSIGAMKNRFRFDPKLKATGTFPNEEKAADTIWKAIQKNQPMIKESLARGKKKIEFEYDAGEIIGKVLKNDGTKTTHETSKVQIVLHPDRHGGYILHTAYPIL